MRRRLSIAILLAGLLGAEIIDRIAVSVGNRVITEADLDREIRITAFLNNGKADFRPANKRETAERMADQMLVRSEMEASRYPPPTAAETDAALAYEKARLGSEAAYRQALSKYGIGEEDLRARLAWQLTLVRFIDVRFRPGIQIGSDQIQKYFDQYMRAGLIQAHPDQTPSVEPYSAGIEQKLSAQAADQLTEQWLREARRRTHIQYRDEVFR